MALLWAIPCCWPRSRGSWPAGTGPGAGPSAARWHTDRPHTHTGSVDSAAPRPNSKTQASLHYKTILSIQYVHLLSLVTIIHEDYILFVSKFMKNNGGCVTLGGLCNTCTFFKPCSFMCALCKRLQRGASHWCCGGSVCTHELAQVSVLRAVGATIIFT